jgi:glycosyltransferase involved in cell wall biosynthesis
VRVAVVHNVARGGAHRRLAEQVHHLDAEVVEICLATSRPVTGTPLRIPLAPRAATVPRALRVPLRYADLALLANAWRRAAAAVRDARADVVYVNPCQVLQCPPLLLARGLPPSLYFCDEPRRVDHEADAAAQRNASTKQIYGPLYAAERQLDRRSVARATALVTNSDYTAGAIRRAYDRDAAPIAMGVADAVRDAPAPPPPAAPAHVLSVGMLTPGKGHDLVLRAVAEAGARWPVMLVAPRDDPAETRRLRAVAAEAGVTLDLRIGISDAELVAAYDGAHAVLYLARAEPLGLVSLEAQSRGVPVIVADEGGLPETIARDVSGFAVPREPAAAAAALRRLDDPATRAAMAAAAREHAAAFTWRRSAAAIAERLAALTAGR